MGQAVADLPDPLESATPAEAQSADDLLSQMAGDEIDRLLAESEGDAAPLARPIGQVASAPAASVQAPAQPPEVAPAPPVESVDLDAVLETAVADHNAAAERSALNPPAHVPAIKQPQAPQIELGDSAKRVPLILRPLEWLSSPLDPWPDQLREILGKIGLITIINALAVLAYVLLVRRHHH
jgi:hypothetical protein